MLGLASLHQVVRLRQDRNRRRSIERPSGGRIESRREAGMPLDVQPIGRAIHAGTLQEVGRFP